MFFLAAIITVSFGAHFICGICVQLLSFRMFVLSFLGGIWDLDFTIMAPAYYIPQNYYSGAQVKSIVIWIFWQA